MKKISIFWILVYVLLNSADANWYWNHSQYFDTSSAIQNCASDLDSTGWWHATYWHSAPADNNSSSSLIPELDTFSVPASWNMRCLYWDAASPSITSLTYLDAWTNVTSQNISFSFSDAGWSGLWRYTLQMRSSSNAPNFISWWSTWNDISWYVDRNISSAPNNFSDSYNFTSWVDGTAYQFRMRVTDIATNQSSWYTSTDILMVDTTSPVVWDIQDSIPGDGGNFLAANSENIQVSVADGWWSPIIEVRGYFEDDSTTDSYLNSAFSSSSNTLSVNYDIRDVDNDREVNGARLYSLKITRVCDQAGNCTIQWNNSSSSVGIKNYVYNVYANTTNITTKDITTENVSNTTNIADGSQRYVRVRLRDVYNNQIIPASGIGRTIRFDVTGVNDLRLDQYNNTGNDSAVFIWNTTTALPIGLGQATTPNLSSTSGDYDIPVYIYSPTNSAYTRVPWWADITVLEFDINRIVSISPGDNPQNQNVDDPSNFFPISVYASELYTADFLWDIENYGFIEWVTQNSSINIVKSPGPTPTSQSVYLEFWGPNEWQLTLQGNGADLSVDEIITEIPDYSTLYKNNSSFIGNKILDTFLTAIGTISGLENTFLVSVIEYNLSGKLVSYPSGIVNKLAYHDTSYTGVASQVGIKVIGNTSSQITQELVINQFSDDVRILGQITKSSLKRDIEKNVYEVTRFIIPKTLWSLTITSSDLSASDWSDSKFNQSGTTSRWISLFSERVLYFGDLSGSNVVINGSSDIDGNKTIVVESGNIYIQGNIEDSDNDGMLWIIALNGNIYIDPSVTDIHAIIYTNKSIISYNGTELDGTNTIAADLANQLFIHGSIFSENTIWGSRKTPIECPYNVDTSCINSQQTAQKYDLNYLRRYFIYDSDGDGTIEYNGDDNPANSWSRSSWGSVGSWYEQFPIIVDYDSEVQQTPPPFFK